MAAGLLRHALLAQPEPLHSLEVCSAGVAARDGEPVSNNSIIALKKVGIDISNHESSILTQELLDRALLILCMTETHRAMIQLQSDPAPKNLFLFRQFIPNSNELEIGDPYGGPLSVYERCRDEMVEAIPSLLDLIRSLTAKR
jgi:protein-tyrosine phosphatase